MASSRSSYTRVNLFDLVRACRRSRTPRRVWPQDLVPDFAPTPVCELAERGFWHEQERGSTDPRMADALEAVLAAETPGLL